LQRVVTTRASRDLHGFVFPLTHCRGFLCSVLRRGDVHQPLHREWRVFCALLLEGVWRMCRRWREHHGVPGSGHALCQRLPSSLWESGSGADGPDLRRSQRRPSAVHKELFHQVGQEDALQVDGVQVLPRWRRFAGVRCRPAELHLPHIPTIASNASA